jgi:hypothetical protein
MKGGGIDLLALANNYAIDLALTAFVLL